MAPPSRVPAHALKRARIGAQIVRHAGCLKPARGIDDDARSDGAPRARVRVLELDGVRARRGVPRRAHDLRPAARVRAQPRARPERVPVCL